MFENRLKILLLLLALPAVAVSVRLVQLQVLRADDYRADAGRMLVRPPKYFPFLRGDITDCQGRRLAYDRPSWEICVHYAALAREPDALRALLRRHGTYRRGRDTDEALSARIDEAWMAISEFSGTPFAELQRRAEEVRDSVSRIKESVERRRGVATVVMEERLAHPIVRDLDQEQGVAASIRFAPYEWIEVQASHSRQYTGGEAVGHLLGQLGPVDAAARERDLNADDELASYRLTDLRGISGVEALGEQWLRGRRGRIEEDIEGRAIRPPVDPVNGQPFRLTIDYPLQQALYNRLAAAVEATPYRTGGCVVVLHVPTRQVLAIVDYPSVDPTLAYADRVVLEQDRIRQPLLFRAVRGYYSPGSIVKPMILAAALAEKVVGEYTTSTCFGRLFLDYPDRWRCTGTHGTVGPVRAVQASCNVYFYHTAEMLKIPRLRDWLPRFGIGQLSGTGLPAEKPGILPTTMSDGQARLAGIGQGELTITPLQAANMVATVAAGDYRPVSLWLDDPAPKPATPLPVASAHWRLVRDGMHKAVNERGGTAFGPDRATIDDAEYTLLGKTGSAEARGHTVEWTYVCHFPDGRVEEIIAGSRESLLARYSADEQPKITGWRWHKRYPPGEPPTHSWFIGYLAPKGRHREAITDEPGAFAIAVLVEYCGHGGEVAAPLARDMINSVLLRYRGMEAEPAPREAF